HVGDLHRVDVTAGVARNRLEETALPAGVEEVEDVATPRPRGARQLARVRQRVDERQVLAERMDDLDREPDAGGRGLGQEGGVGVPVDARRAFPGPAVAPAAQHEERITVEPVDVFDGAAYALHAAPDRP